MYSKQFLFNNEKYSIHLNAFSNIYLSLLSDGHMT